MKTKDLRVLFVVDAMKGRNGVGAYFQDLVAHLDGVVARAELVSPSLEDPHPCQGLSMPIPGDPTQRLFLPKMRELTALVWEMKPHVIVIPGPGIFSLGAFWVARKLGIPVCVTFQTDYDSLVRLYWGPRLARLAGGLLNWVNRTLFQGSSAVATSGAASASAQLVLYFYVWASWWTGRSAGWWLGGWSDGKEPTLRLGDRVMHTAVCLMAGIVITLGVVALAA